MKKTFKIFILLSLILLFLLIPINVFSINMNLENTSSVNTANIVEEAKNKNNSSDTTLRGEVEVDIPKVTTSKNTDDNEFLTAENILAIIIIVIGVLLVLLAIAILIRLR